MKPTKATIARFWVFIMIAILGGFCILGTAGSYEMDAITMVKCLSRSFGGFVLVMIGICGMAWNG